MNPISKFAFVRGYFRQRMKIIALFFLFILLFALVFFLSNLPLDPILYAALLCGACAFLFALYDVWSCYRQHAALLDLKSRIVTGLDVLPETVRLLERDYQELLQVLYAEKARLESEAAMQKTEMIDYYTLWAHQIKTPISAMRLLLETAPPETAGQFKPRLFEIEQYVEMVLQYLRLESISSDLKFQTYDLTELVRQAVHKYAPIFIHQKLFLHFSALDCQVLTDEKWLVFVVEQLLSNARKYTRSGGISIYMAPEEEKTLVIEDTGIGIEPEDLPRVFEKGFTGYNGRMDKQSTGIGLYLCQRIVQRLSHTISISSQLGKGTRVKIRFASEELNF